MKSQTLTNISKNQTHESWDSLTINRYMTLPVALTLSFPLYSFAHREEELEWCIRIFAMSLSTKN